MAEIIKEALRHEFATFIKVGGSFVLMGEGIQSQTIAYNPTVKEVGYIHETAKRKKTTGYAPTIDTPQEASIGDPVFDYVDGLRRTMALGSDLKTEVILVYIYAPAEGGGYEATKHDASIQINDFGGEGQDSLVINYAVTLEGTPQIGTATIAEGVATFTPAV